MANGLLNWYKKKLTSEGTDVSKYSDEQLTLSLGRKLEGQYGPQKVKEYPEFSKQYTSAVNAREAKRLGRDGFFGPIKEAAAGFGQGLDETQGMLYGGGGYLAKKVGLDSASDWMMEKSMDNMEESQKNAPTIQSHSEVNSVGEAFRFLSGGLGRVLPSGLTMIGTGGVAGLAGKQILKKAVVGPALRKEAQRRAKEGIGGANLLRSSASKRYAELSPTMQEVAKNYAKGVSLVGGTAASSGTMGIGEVYSSLYPYTQLDPQDKDYVTPEDAEALSLKFGLAIGALDSVLPSMLGPKVLNRFFPGKTPTVVDAARADAFVKRNIFKSIAKGMAVEGSTEATQEYLNVVAEKFAHNEDSPFDLTEFNEQEVNTLIDGGILGMIGGGVFGVAGSGNAEIKRRKVEKQRQEAQDKKLKDLIQGEVDRAEAKQKAVDAITPTKTFDIGQQVKTGDGRVGIFAGLQGDDALIDIQENAELEKVTRINVGPARALSAVVEEESTETTDAFQPKLKDGSVTVKDWNKPSGEKLGAIKEVQTINEDGDRSLIQLKFREDGKLDQAIVFDLDKDGNFLYRKTKDGKKTDTKLTRSITVPNVVTKLNEAGNMADESRPLTFNDPVPEAILYGDKLYSETITEENPVDTFREEQKQAQEEEKQATPEKVENPRDIERQEKQVLRSTLEDNVPAPEARALEYLGDFLQNENLKVGEISLSKLKNLDNKLVNAAYDLWAEEFYIQGEYPSKQELVDAFKEGIKKKYGESFKSKGDLINEQNVKQAKDAAEQAKVQAEENKKENEEKKKLDRIASIAKNPTNRFYVSAGGATDLTNVNNAINVIANAKNEGRDLKINPVTEEEFNRFSNDATIKASLIVQSAGGTGRIQNHKTYEDYVDDIDNLNTVVNNATADQSKIDDILRRNAPKEKKVVEKDQKKKDEDTKKEVETVLINGSTLEEIPAIENGEYSIDNKIIRVTDTGTEGKNGAAFAGGRPSSISDFFSIDRVMPQNGVHGVHTIITPSNESLKVVFDGVSVTYKLKEDKVERVLFNSSKDSKYFYGKLGDETESVNLANPTTQDHIQLSDSVELFAVKKPSAKDAILKKPKEVERKLPITTRKSGSNNVVVVRHIATGALFARTIQGSDILEFGKKFNNESPVVTLRDNAGKIPFDRLPKGFEYYGAVLLSGHPGKFRMDFDNQKTYEDWLDSFEKVEIEASNVTTRVQRSVLAKNENKETITIGDYQSPMKKWDKYFDAIKGSLKDLEVNEVIRTLEETIIDGELAGKKLADRILRLATSEDKLADDFSIAKADIDLIRKAIKGVTKKNASDFAHALQIATRVQFELGTEDSRGISELVSPGGVSEQILDTIADPSELSPQESAEQNDGVYDMFSIPFAKQFAPWITTDQIKRLNSYSKKNLQGIKIDEVIERIKLQEGYKQEISPETATTPNRIVYEVIQNINTDPKFAQGAVESTKLFYQYIQWLGGQTIAPEIENSILSTSSTTEQGRSEWEKIVSHFNDMSITIKDNTQSIIQKISNDSQNENFDGANLSTDATTELATRVFELIAFHRDFDTSRGEIVLAITDITNTRKLFSQIGEAIGGFTDKNSTTKKIEEAIEGVFTEEDVRYPSDFINILKEVMLDAFKQVGLTKIKNPYPALNGKQLWVPISEVHSDEVKAHADNNIGTSAPLGEQIQQMADSYPGSAPQYSIAENADAYNATQLFKHGSNYEQAIYLPEGQEALNDKAIQEIIGDNVFAPIVLEKIKRHVENTGKSPEAKDFVSRYIEVMDNALSNRDTLSIQVVDEISSAPGQLTRGSYINDLVVINRQFFAGELDLKQDLPLDFTEDQTTNVLMSVVMHEVWHGTMEVPLRAYEDGKATPEINKTVDLIKDVITEIKEAPGASEFSFLFTNDMRSVSETLNYAWTRKDFAKFLSNTELKNDGLKKRIDQNGKGFISTLMDALLSAYSKLLGVMGINVEGTALESILELSKQLEAQSQALLPQQEAEGASLLAAMADNPAPIFYSQMEKVLNVVQGETTQSQEEIQLRQELNQIKKELPEYFNGDKKNDTEGKVALLKQKGAIENQLKGFAKPKALPKEATGKRWKKILIDEGVSANELKVTIGSLLDEIGDRKINLPMLRKIANAANQVPIVSEYTKIIDNPSDYSSYHDFQRFETEELITQLVTPFGPYDSNTNLNKYLTDLNQERIKGIFKRAQAFGIKARYEVKDESVTLLGESVEAGSGIRSIEIKPFEIPAEDDIKELSKIYTAIQTGKLGETPIESWSHDITEPTESDIEKYKEKSEQARKAIKELYDLSAEVDSITTEIFKQYRGDPSSGQSLPLSVALNRINETVVTDDDIVEVVKVLNGDNQFRLPEYWAGRASERVKIKNIEDAKRAIISAIYKEIYNNTDNAKMLLANPEGNWEVPPATRIKRDKVWEQVIQVAKILAASKDPARYTDIQIINANIPKLLNKRKTNESALSDLATEQVHAFAKENYEKAKEFYAPEDSWIVDILRGLEIVKSSSKLGETSIPDALKIDNIPESIKSLLKNLETQEVRLSELIEVDPKHKPSDSIKVIISGIYDTPFNRLNDEEMRIQEDAFVVINAHLNLLQDGSPTDKPIDILNLRSMDKDSASGRSLDWITSLYVKYNGGNIYKGKRSSSGTFLKTVSNDVVLNPSSIADSEFQGRTRFQGTYINSTEGSDKITPENPVMRLKGDTSLEYLEDPYSYTSSPGEGRQNRIKKLEELTNPIKEELVRVLDVSKGPITDIRIHAPAYSPVELSDVTAKKKPEILGFLPTKLPSSQRESLIAQGYSPVKGQTFEINNYGHDAFDPNYYIYLVQALDENKRLIPGAYQVAIQQEFEFAGNVSSQTKKVESVLTGLGGKRTAIDIAKVIQYWGEKYGDVYVGTHSEEKFRKYENILNLFKFKTQVGTAQEFGFREQGRLIKVLKPESKPESREIKFALDKALEKFSFDRNIEGMKKQSLTRSHFDRKTVMQNYETNFLDPTQRMETEVNAKANVWIRGFQRQFNGVKSFVISELQSDSKQEQQKEKVTYLRQAVVNKDYNFTEGYMASNQWSNKKKYEVGDVAFLPKEYGSGYAAWELTRPLTEADIFTQRGREMGLGYRSPFSYIEEGKVESNTGPWRLLSYRSSGVTIGTEQNPGVIPEDLSGTNLYHIKFGDTSQVAHFYKYQIKKIKELGQSVKGNTITVSSVVEARQKADKIFAGLERTLDNIDSLKSDLQEAEESEINDGVVYRLSQQIALEVEKAKIKFNLAKFTPTIDSSLSSDEMLKELRREQIIYQSKGEAERNRIFETPEFARDNEFDYWAADNGGYAIAKQQSNESPSELLERFIKNPSDKPKTEDILLDAYQLSAMKALIRHLSLNKINKVVFTRGDVIYPVVSTTRASIRENFGDGKPKTQGIISAYAPFASILGKYLGIKPQLEEGNTSAIDGKTKEQFMTITIPDERLAQNLQNGERLLMQDDLSNARRETRTNLKVTKDGSEYTVENLFNEPYKTTDEDDINNIVRFKNVPSRLGILVKGDNGQPIVKIDGDNTYNLINLGDSEKWVNKDTIESYDRNDLMPSNMSDQLTFDFGKSKKPEGETESEIEVVENTPEIVRIKNVGNKYLVRLIARDISWEGTDRKMDIQLANQIAEHTDVPFQTVLNEIDSIHAIHNATPLKYRYKFQYLAMDKGIKKYFGKGQLMEDVYADEENPNVGQPLNREANEVALAKMEIASRSEELASTSEAMEEIRKILKSPDLTVEDVYQRFLPSGKTPIDYIQSKSKLYANIENTTLQAIKNNEGMVQHARTLALNLIEKRRKQAREFLSQNLDQLDKNQPRSLASEIEALENEIKPDPAIIFNRATQGDKINEQVKYYAQDTRQEILEGVTEIDSGSSATLQAFKEITGEESPTTEFLDSLTKIKKFNTDFISDLVLKVSKSDDIQALGFNDIYNIISVEKKVSENEYIIIASAIHNNKKSVLEAKLSTSNDFQGKRSTLAKLDSLSKSTIDQLRVIKGRNPSESLLSGAKIEKDILSAFIDKRIKYLEKVKESEDLLRDNQVYSSLIKYYKINSDRLQTYLGHTPITHITDGMKFPVMNKVAGKYQISHIKIRMSNKMLPEDMQEFIMSRQANREYLKDPENEKIHNTSEFEYIRTATLAADAATLQPQHKEAQSKKNMWFLKSAQEMFTEMGRLGREVAQMELKFDIAYRKHVSKARAFGKQWNKKVTNATKAWGYKNERLFLDDVYDKALKWSEDQPQINDKASFDSGTFDKAMSVVRNPDLITSQSEARDSLRQLFEQSKIISDWFLSLGREYNVKVRQDQGRDSVMVESMLGDGEMIPLDRDPIKRGYQTSGRKIRSEVVLGIVNELSTGIGDVEAWEEVSESYKDTALTDKVKEDKINAYLEVGITESVLNSFIRPYVFDSSITNLITAPIKTQGKLSKKQLKEAWAISKGTGHKKFLSWIDTLYESANHNKKRTDYLSFKYGVAKAFYERFGNLERAVSDNGLSGDNKAYALAHRIMDSRATQTIMPVEFLQYESYTEVDMPIQLAQIIGNGIYGRNAEKLTAVKEQLKKELEDKRARLVRIADVLGENPPNDGKYTVRRGLRTKAAQIAESMDDIPGETGLEKLKNLESATRQLQNFHTANKHLMEHLDGDLGPYKDHKMTLELLGTNAFLILNQPKSGFTNFLSLADQLIVYKGTNQVSMKAVRSSLKNAFGNTFGPMMEFAGLQLKLTSEYAKVLNDPYFHNSEHEVGYDTYRRNLGAGASKKSSLIEIFKLDGLRQLKDTIQYTPTNPDQNYGPVGLRTMFLNPFTYLGNLANHSLGVGVCDAVDMLVKKTADFIEQTGKRTGQPLPQTYQVTAENLGFDSKSKSALGDILKGEEAVWNYLNNAIELRGLGTISDLAHQYIERKAKGKTLALTDDQALAVSAIALHDVAMEGGFSSRAAFWYTSPVGRYTSPLLSWAFSKVNQVNKSFRDEQTEELNLRASLRSLSVMSLWLAPIGMAFTFGMDEYDEEILGKSSSLRPAPLTTMIPLFGPFIEGDAKSNALAMTERLARAGNIGGVAGDFIASMVSQIDPYASQRGFSVDTRVLGIATIMNIMDAMKNAYHSRSFDYNLVTRPLLYSMGANGILQNHQAITNLMGLDTVERRVSDMIGNRNKVRSALSALEIERRPAVSGGFMATPFSIHIRKMEQAAYANDSKLFAHAYSEAVLASIERGDEDPEKSVLQAYKRRTLKSGLSRYTLSDNEWSNVLNVLKPEQAKSLRRAESMHKKYENILLDTIELEANPLPVPIVDQTSTKRMSMDDIIKQSLSF
jgi:hypothetical protein